MSDTKKRYVLRSTLSEPDRSGIGLDKYALSLSLSVVITYKVKVEEAKNSGCLPCIGPDRVMQHCCNERKGLQLKRESFSCKGETNGVRHQGLSPSRCLPNNKWGNSIRYTYYVCVCVVCVCVLMTEESLYRIHFPSTFSFHSICVARYIRTCIILISQQNQN